MSAKEQLDQLKEMLESNLIKKRNIGIGIAKKMLASDSYRVEVRSLLRGIAENDPIIGIQEAAKAALDADDARRNLPNIQHPDHVFDARCSKGHLSYYNKREYCSKRRNVVRHVADMDSKHPMDMQSLLSLGGKLILTSLDIRDPLGV